MLHVEQLRSHVSRGTPAAARATWNSRRCMFHVEQPHPGVPPGSSGRRGRSRRHLHEPEDGCGHGQRVPQRGPRRASRRGATGAPCARRRCPVHVGATVGRSSAWLVCASGSMFHVERRKLWAWLQRASAQRPGAALWRSLRRPGKRPADAACGCGMFHVERRLGPRLARHFQARFGGPWRGASERHAVERCGQRKLTVVRLCARAALQCSRFRAMTGMSSISRRVEPPWVQPDRATTRACALWRTVDKRPCKVARRESVLTLRSDPIGARLEACTTARGAPHAVMFHVKHRQERHA